MENVFQTSESHQISRELANEYFNNYLNASVDKGEPPETILKWLQLDIKAINAILNQKTKPATIRMYFGKKRNDPSITPDHTLILVGVDENGENILDSGEIWDEAKPCPYNCPPPETDFEQ